VKVFFKDVDISTRNRTELVDITKSVEEIMGKSGVAAGLCVIHTVHSTTTIIVNENEAGLMKDIVRKIQQDFPRGAGLAA
jgi:secondary thiamine-phosphate synthase enzyme